MTDKIYGISLSRLTATMMILSCHLFQFYGSEAAWWLNSGVNVFLIISGFLYGKKTYKFNTAKNFCLFSLKFYAKEFSKILIPLFLHILIFIPIYLINGTKFIDLLKLFLLNNNGISGFGYMWYFKYILICYALIPFYYLFPENKIKSAFLYMMLLLALIFSKGNLIWYTSFLLGIVLSRIYLTKHFRYLYIISTIIALAMAIICIIYKIDRININYILNIQKLSMACCIVLLSLKLIDYKKPNDKLRKLYDYSDSVSYSVFLIHPIFVSGCLSMLKLTQFTLINIFVCLIFILSYAHFFSKLCKYILKNLLSKIIKVE